MKKNMIFNKYYRHLRNNVFPDLPLNEFIEVYTIQIAKNSKFFGTKECTKGRITNIEISF